MGESILQEKSYAFALRIVNLADYLNEKKHEYILARKVLDSGTAIGMLSKRRGKATIAKILRKNCRLQMKKHLRHITG
jgi:hypothetical protein